MPTEVNHDHDAGPLRSAYEIAEAHTNHKAALTVADWARRTQHSDEALLEVIDILGIGSADKA
jgi:hypothetical protein